MKTITTGPWTDRIIEIRRALQTAIMSAIDVRDDMPEEMKDCVLEEALYAQLREACDTCDQMIGRLIAWAEPPPSAAANEPIDRPENDEERTNRVFVEDWGSVIDDPVVDRALRRLRDSIPRDFCDMEHIVKALLEAWMMIDPAERVRHLANACGLNSEDPAFDCDLFAEVKP
jgi:hypothetical protein